MLLTGCGIWYLVITISNGSPCRYISYVIVPTSGQCVHLLLPEPNLLLQFFCGERGWTDSPYHRLVYKLRIGDLGNGDCIMYYSCGPDQFGQLSRCPACPWFASDYLIKPSNLSGYYVCQLLSRYRFSSWTTGFTTEEYRIDSPVWGSHPFSLQCVPWALFTRVELMIWLIHCRG
jgi:hypothetical protein